jgi:outer membrane protein TolC
MKCINILLIIFLLSGISGMLVAQNVLTKEEAVQLALENNFGIRLSENAVALARNNTSKYNTGQLPTVTANGGFNYSLDNTTANFQDGRTTTLSFADSRSANASVGANYTIFDGFFRKYNIQQLQERYTLSELEVKATMENVAAQTLSQYYQIASLVENLDIIDEAIEISRRRLERAEQQFEYGQGNRLGILNAQVDLNNDSLTYFNTNIQINNAKRLLNNLMVDMESLDYVVDQNTDFIGGLDKNALKESMLNDNVSLSQIDKNIELGGISINLANARKLPTVGANISYGYAYSKNNSASFLSSINNNGLNVGVTVAWNIFDGGTTRHALEQARLNNVGLVLQKEQIIENLEFQFENTWANYRNTLFIYETNEKNVTINRANFERTEEQFKIGQINSVDFRQAQLNLLNAETALNTSKLQVKIAEVELLLLSGRIL